MSRGPADRRHAGAVGRAGHRAADGAVPSSAGLSAGSGALAARLSGKNMGRSQFGPRGPNCAWSSRARRAGLSLGRSGCLGEVSVFVSRDCGSVFEMVGLTCHDRRGSLRDVGFRRLGEGLQPASRRDKRRGCHHTEGRARHQYRLRSWHHGGRLVRRRPGAVRDSQRLQSHRYLVLHYVASNGGPIGGNSRLCVRQQPFKSGQQFSTSTSRIGPRRSSHSVSGE